jgi:putative iron-dependent peroxidase
MRTSPSTRRRLGFTLPQLGIFAQGTHAHFFLEFDLRPGVGAGHVVASFKELGVSEVSAGGANLVLAFGADAWREVAGAQAPGDLARFEEIDGPEGGNVPAAQHDAWIWISAASPDEAWERGRAATRTLGEVAELKAEQQAFTYRRGRDVTGFIDGTANPRGLHAAEVALVPPGAPGEGGSHVLSMRWRHDLTRFQRLPVEDQERVFGRTKPDSVELGPEEKPADAHIARVEVEDEAGEELEIYRRSVPWGSALEQGLQFVAFSADPARYETMLARMFGSTADGVRDRLTDYSHPDGGACYFAPSMNELERVAEGAP